MMMIIVSDGGSTNISFPIRLQRTINGYTFTEGKMRKAEVWEIMVML
jgi:hypothetical protein